MANIIVIEDDARIERQIKMFLNELSEDNKVRFFPSSEIFEKKYCFTKESQEAEAKANEKATDKAADEELFQLLSSVDLVVFKSQCIKEEVRGWVTKTLKQLKINKFCTQERPTRFMVLKYEDDGVDKDYFVHPLVEDIIFLPLDRLLFLQKIEIVLNLPRKTTPSFLFSQPVEQNIEISKKTLIEKISDMGFAIRNPFRIASGTINHFYLRLPSQTETFDVYARALYSEPHPEAANQFLVYYTFLGVTAKVAQNLRKFLTSQPGYKDLENDQASAFKYKPPPKEVVLENERNEKTIAILDTDTHQADLLEDIIKSEIDQVKIVKESSFYFFTKKYIEKETVSAVPGEPNDLYSPTVSWSIRLNNLSLVEVQTKPAANSLLVGHNAAAMFGRPTGWNQLFAHPESKAMLEEALTLCRSGQKYSQNTILQDANSLLKYFNMTATITKDKEVAKIELRPPEVVKKKDDDKKITALDLIVVNQSLLPENVDGWADRLKEIARKNSVIGPDKDVPIIIISDEKSGWAPRKIRYQKVFGLLYKPFKNRALCYSVSSAINSPYTKYNHSNIVMVKAVIPVFVAIESQLENLSEYGATITAARPFAAGTCLYIHESIFSQAPDGYLCARFYFAEENQKKKGKFSCYLLYFGITDQFLKFIRNWIRKDFAEKKQGQGG